MYLCVMTEFVLVLTKLFFVCQMVFSLLMSSSYYMAIYYPTVCWALF